MIELMPKWCGIVTDGSFVAQRESHFRLHCAVRVQNHSLFPRGNFGNLSSRLEEDKPESWAGITFFLPATRVYFVIELAQATKH